MTRAVVFGGGGPVGIAWESGLVVGLARRGIGLGEADRVVGTSAGSVVGARLASGGDLSRAPEELEVRNAGSASGSGEGMAERLTALMAIMAEVAGPDGISDEGRARLGGFALEQETMPEERFVGFFGDLAERRWPERFACTAIDTADGSFRVWDADAGVDLQLAVASSCSVPGIYPPITIRGGRYMDGGMRSPLNADLVAGAERAVVVSVLSASMPGSTVAAEMAALRDGGTEAVLIEPDAAFEELTGSGAFLMDPSRALAAFELGVALGEAEAERVGAAWRS